MIYSVVCYLTFTSIVLGVLIQVLIFDCNWNKYIYKEIHSFFKKSWRKSWEVNISNGFNGQFWSIWTISILWYSPQLSPLPFFYSRITLPFPLTSLFSDGHSLWRHCQSRGTDDRVIGVAKKLSIETCENWRYSC